MEHVTPQNAYYDDSDSYENKHVFCTYRILIMAR